MDMELWLETRGVIQDADRGRMYICRCNAMYGAIALACDDAIGKIQDIVGKEFIVLPSSVQEVLVMPIQEEFDFEGMACMVREINRSSVLPDEVLSDHVYGYIDGKMEILA